MVRAYVHAESESEPEQGSELSAIDRKIPIFKILCTLRRLLCDFIDIYNKYIQIRMLLRYTYFCIFLYMEFMKIRNYMASFYLISV